MARLQILELPMVHNGDVSETPFILVIDEWAVDTMEEHAALNAYWDDFGKKIGARGILFADRSLRLPANDPLPDVDDAFKAEVQQWAAGTNETIARLIEALSYRQKRPRRDDDNDATGDLPPTLDDEQYREQIREGVLYAQGKVTRTVQSADDA